MAGPLCRYDYWGYRQRAIFGISLTVVAFASLLGKMIGGGMSLTIALVSILKMAAAFWPEIPTRFSLVNSFEYEVLSDLFYGTEFMQEPGPKMLGSIVDVFKAHKCSLFQVRSAPLTLLHSPRNKFLISAVKGPPQTWSWRGSIDSKTAQLCSRWGEDTLLFQKGLPASTRGYILDNPACLCMNRVHSELSKIVRFLACCFASFPEITNKFLLNTLSKRQVPCSFMIAPAVLASLNEKILSAAHKGIAWVSNCTADRREKWIVHSGLKTCLPLIVLVENGFSQNYKLPNSYFEGGAARRLHSTGLRPQHRGDIPTFAASAWLLIIPSTPLRG